MRQVLLTNMWLDLSVQVVLKQPLNHKAVVAVAAAAAG